MSRASRSRPSTGAGASATFYTITDARFAPGTYAMINSLRLHGHAEPVVILDVGLRADQRRLLEPAASLIAYDRSQATNPTLFKPFARLAEPRGVTVIIDSDQIVTHTLSGVVEMAAAGAICAFPDPESERWFEEWSSLFGLGAALRRETYVNAGFVAFSTERWPWLLDRWWELCRTIWQVPTIYERDGDGPAAQADQDALNALLMSEVPSGSVTLLDAELAPAAEALAEGVEIVDLRRLECRFRGKTTLLLHSAGKAKPWLARDWPHVRGTAYVRLLRRVLAADDVELRPPARDLPPWLRRGRAGAMLMVVMNVVLGLASRVARLPLVRPVARRILRALG